MAMKKATVGLLLKTDDYTDTEDTSVTFDEESFYQLTLEDCDDYTDIEDTSVTMYRYPDDIYPHLKKRMKRKKTDKEILAKSHQVYRYPEDIYPHLKKCVKGQKKDKEILAICKGYQDDEILEEDKSNSRKKKRKKKSSMRETPNYFLSVQMTNQQIHSKIEEIQKVIVAQMAGLKSTMVSVKKLHLTLAVYNFKDELDISKARNAMDNFLSTWKSKSQPLINISVSGIGNFRHQVVFASLSEDSEFEQLKVLVSHILTAFEEAGLKATDDRFSPHVTIAKMSKSSQNLRKQGIKKIDDKLYEDVKSTYFGQQVVDKIQLCSMYEPGDQHGYYYVEYDIDM